MSKLCKDCKYFSEEDNIQTSKCTHERAIVTHDLIYGNNTFAECKDMRSDSKLCGSSGIFFINKYKFFPGIF